MAGILPDHAVAQSLPANRAAARSGGVNAAPGQASRRLASRQPRKETSAVSAKASAGGLTIIPTFDSSITSNPNAAAIENSISAAIDVLEALFSDPITVTIYFQYSATQPGGQPADLSNSFFGYYSPAYATYLSMLKAGASTANDATALGNLPANPPAGFIAMSSALGRALGFNNSPGVVDSGGGINRGGTFDGIVTLNSTLPLQFTRAGGISPTNYDAQRLVEHEIDEVMGFGSILPSNHRLQRQRGTEAGRPLPLCRRRVR